MSDTRNYILKTSLFLFLQKSYKDVTMKEIVEKTGLSKGAFYHYFSSKDQLFEEIVNMFFTMGAVDYSLFDKSTLHGFYTEYANYLNSVMMKINEEFSDPTNKKNSFNFFLILFEAINRFPKFMTTELEMHKKDIEAWKSVIANAKLNGEINSAATNEDIANLFLYCNDGVFIRYINNDNSLDFNELLLTSYNTIYVGLKV